VKTWLIEYYLDFMFTDKYEEIQSKIIVYTNVDDWIKHRSTKIGAKQIMFLQYVVIIKIPLYR
jgi:hypothetical protein